ncbi:RNA polymeras-like protein I subunit hRPA39, partial [Wallemia mellicola CBS 633.66]|uniref:DNA-directed RNA polymerases I and III subunit RPAC1 n=2 Tax=Wallemia mellicola TaxID=1708541 RepID=A0A4T0QJZ5_9BASI
MADRDERKIVRLDKERTHNVHSTDFPGNYPGENLEWNLEAFKKNLTTHVNAVAEDEIEFDLIGVDPSIANALRRVMIAEVPTVAVENVFVFNNTSVMHDEVMAHRLGLVPILFDAERLEEFQKGDSPNDQNTIVFTLQVACTRKAKVAAGETDPDKIYENHKVYSKDFKWVPQGGQASDPLFTDNPPRVAYPEILITKLRPGQSIDLELHCVKGLGQDHAKFSPAATASYRLLPTVKLHQPIKSEHAELFASCFSEGVVEVRENKKGEKEAHYVNPRKDTVSREVLRHPEFDGVVELGRIRDHFIFNIETTGAVKSVDMLPRSCNVIKSKVQKIREGLNTIVHGKQEEEEENADEQDEQMEE